MALTKLKIESYATPACTGSALGTIDAMFNPATYSRNYDISYVTSKEANRNEPTLLFRGIDNTDLSLDLIVDGTGIVPIPGAKTVDAYITNFKKLVYRYQGSQHRPNYLKITWANLSFIGVCKSINIAYTLFNEDGSALRATIKVTFSKSVDYSTKAKEAQKSSPDLTHIRTVQAGDTLPLMTYRIYGDSAYYLQVAEANNLTSVADIKPGDQIYFPPIKK
ncbi:hypothetical protein MUY27_01305 [Mucilaginibacter sp. RS28]|uniref:LysM domain-containing protein n=1 Tax=Mucilaginibacter straminoryzae TaxID=2932774 RepID=A0A9X1X0V9_9SPHI|nr:hypothetical protein [Mucilaginibacter straminoryzae]MCJ8208325.1 hypothetical protein [Mucilaginibacter straminoryzae]